MPTPPPPPRPPPVSNPPPRPPPLSNPAPLTPPPRVQSIPPQSPRPSPGSNPPPPHHLSQCVPAQVSKNFVVVEPYLINIVEGLRIATIRSQNTIERLRNAASMNWESSWTGEWCYGEPVIQLVQSWFKHTDPLWELEGSLLPAALQKGNASRAKRRESEFDEERF